MVAKPARRLLGRCSDGAGSGGDRDSQHDSWDRADGSNGHSYRGWMWAGHARPAGSWFITPAAHEPPVCTDTVIDVMAVR